MQRLFAKFLISFWLFLLSAAIWAQSDAFTIDRYTVSDGLAENTVNCLLQDYLGFLWVGTAAGLHKYDGYTFEVYKEETEENSSIRKNEILALYEDQQRRLWVGSGDGLRRYLRETDALKKYPVRFPDSTNQSPPAIRIFETDKQNLHAQFAGKQVFQLDAAADTLIARNVFDETMQTSTAHILTLDSNGNHTAEITFPEWTFNEILQYKYVVRRADGSVLWEPHPDASGGQLHGDRTIHLSGAEMTLSPVIFNTWTTPSSAAKILKKIPRKMNQLKTTIKFAVNLQQLEPPLASGDTVEVRGEFFPLSWGGTPLYLIRNQALNFPKNEEGEIFVSSLIDGYKWTSNTWRIKKISPSTESTKNINFMMDQTNDLVIDHSGLIWFGTQTGGLYKLDRSAAGFQSYTSDLWLTGGEQRILKAICEDSNGNLWLGGGLDGILRINQRTKKVTRFANHDMYTPDSLTHPEIDDIYEDSQKSLWITTPTGLHKYKDADQRFTLYSLIDREGVPIPVRGIYEDPDGKIFTGTQRLTLLRYDPLTQSWKFFHEFKENADWYRSGNITKIIGDENGLIWIGSSNAGVIRFDPATGLMKGYKKNPGPYRTITAMLIDQNGQLWYGTQRQGLFQFDRENGSENRISEADGLLHNSVLGLEEDNKGNIWISTLRGLSRYDPIQKTFRHFFKEDGLHGNAFAPGAHFKSRNGKLFFGGPSGISTFHPDSLKDHTIAAPIVLTDFKVNNRQPGFGKDSPLEKHVSISEQISLHYDQNDISLTFSELYYRSMDSKFYSFILENYETEWRPPSSERVAYYTNLDPGEYIFRVSACWPNGIRKAAEASVRIIISPPWWQTIWAYLIYALSFIALLIGLRRYELNRQQLRHQVELEKVETRKLKEIDQMKSQFFANISHEFRTPLTLILGPLESWLKEKQLETSRRNQYQIMHRNGSRLLKLINQLLDLAKLEAGGEALQAAQGDIIRLLRRVFATFASRGDRNNIRMMFNDAPLITEAGHPAVYAYFDSDKLENVFVNILSNAFKFTPPGGEISVAVAVHGNDKRKLPQSTSGFVEMIFANTGPGIPAVALPYVFDRFFQADESATRSHEGTGIGLSLAKELVEMHHGEITVESTVNEVTTFTIRLPLGKAHLLDDQIMEIRNSESEILNSEDIDETSQKEIETTNSKSQIDNSEFRIPNSEIVLVVEDHQDLRAFIRDQLAGDYKIIEAENGKLGWEKAEVALPDIIISDVMMPEMDGYALCERIKSDRKTSHIPVILLTARASRQDKMDGLETGADDYLVKPFDAEELKVRVANLINLRKQIREKFTTEMLLKPAKVTVPSVERQFLEQLSAAIEANIADENFGVEALGAAVGLSRSQTYRKLQALTGQSPRDFIRNFRLERAASLIKQNAGNIAEITYMVGFNSQAYFTRCFQDVFHCSPTEYRRANQVTSET